MPDFPTNPLPEYPIEETLAAPEVLVSKHKDGSEQRRLKGAGDGAIFKLTFGSNCPITKTQCDSLLNHFAGQNGTLTAFHWLHPETEVTYLVRYLETPSAHLVGFNAYEVGISLKQVPA